MLKRVSALLAVLSMVVALGCGGDDDNGGSPNRENQSGVSEAEGDIRDDEADVRETAERMVDALWGDDPGSSCDYFTDAYAEQVVKDAQSGDLDIEADSCEAVMVAGAALAKGFGAEKPEVGRITINGDEARVVLDEGEEAATNVFVRDGDDWLLDREVESADEPTAAEVKQWPEKWCHVQPGMTKDEVIEIMGEPTGQFEGTNPQLNYDAFEYGFTAFFGVDGTVRQLDANTINLAPEQVEAIPCETTRR